jgi:hypothetical protein
MCEVDIQVQNLISDCVDCARMKVNGKQCHAFAIETRS